VPKALREPIKPAQSAQGKTINNLLYSEHEDTKCTYQQSEAESK